MMDTSIRMLRDKYKTYSLSQETLDLLREWRLKGYKA